MGHLRKECSLAIKKGQKIHEEVQGEVSMDPTEEKFSHIIMDKKDILDISNSGIVD